MVSVLRGIAVRVFVHRSYHLVTTLIFDLCCECSRPLVDCGRFFRSLRLRIDFFCGEQLCANSEGGPVFVNMTASLRPGPGPSCPVSSGLFFFPSLCCRLDHQVTVGVCLAFAMIMCVPLFFCFWPCVWHSLALGDTLVLGFFFFGQLPFMLVAGCL